MVFFDGVTNELTVGDMTVVSIYLAALERPVSKIERADLGLIDLSEREREDIMAGEVPLPGRAVTVATRPR